MPIFIKNNKIKMKNKYNYLRLLRIINKTCEFNTNSKVFFYCMIYYYDYITNILFFCNKSFNVTKI